MKKFLLVIFVILLGIMGTYYYLTLQLVNTADNFFLSIKENNITKAEQYLSKDFKSNINTQQLAEYLVRYQMHNYQSLEWGYKRIIDMDKKGSLEGTITNQKGIASPLTMQFKKEGSEWKILAMEKVLSDTEKKEQKLLADYTQMARINMHNLGQALNDNNMTLFYQTISKVWQKEATVKKLKKTYGVFKEKGVNLLGLDKGVPKLTTVNIGKNGILTLGGFYQIGSKNRLIFIHKYIPENKIWKLAGLSIQIK